MKKIVLMALLSSAGCSKKGPDCTAAIDKGVDGYVAAMMKKVANPPKLDIDKIASRMKATMAQRCTEDRWQPDVVACIGTAIGPDAMKACEEKMTRDQRSRLRDQMRPVAMDAIGASGAPTPPGLEGHPPMLGGAANGSAAPSGDPAGAPAPGGSAAASAPPSPPSSGGW